MRISLREWAAVLPLIVMMVWMGVYSQSFLPPVSRNTARVLEQTNVNVPYRVRMWDRPPGLSKFVRHIGTTGREACPTRSWLK